MNTKWHKENKMPKNPTLGERIKWHIAHEKNCNCAPMPDGVRREINKRKR